MTFLFQMIRLKMLLYVDIVKKKKKKKQNSKNSEGTNLEIIF